MASLAVVDGFYFRRLICQKCPLAEASSRNALGRFDGVIQKKFPDILDGYSEDTFRAEEREEVTELFGFIDDV